MVEAAGACFCLATQPPPLLHQQHINVPAASSLFSSNQLTPQFLPGIARLSSSPSSHLIKGRINRHVLRRAISASQEDSSSFFPEDDINHLIELADGLRGSNQQDNSSDIIPDSISSTIAGSRICANSTNSSSDTSSITFPSPNWPNLIPPSVEKSLRMIKLRKNNNSSGITIEESAECSVKKAFSSMVFIIRELQSYTLELLFVEKKLQGILDRVQGDMHASFVWLFQQIFSCTPTLMLSLMLLLANFTVHSAGHTAAAIVTIPPSHSTTVIAEKNNANDQFDHKSFSLVNDDGKAVSVGCSGSGGDKTRPVAGATDDGRSEGRAPSSSSYYSSTDVAPSTTTSTEESTTLAAVPDEKDEDRLWNMVVEEALRMQAALRDETLMDPEILQRLVSPVTAEAEQEDQSTYTRTELTYYKAIEGDPHNPLLLCNFAQFLYIVIRDYDRAEYYFKQAVQTGPRDAESLGRYASFLWLGRKDLVTAEETYLEAIAADPDNSFHTSSYAHFLYSTGGEDTCYPL